MKMFNSNRNMRINQRKAYSGHILFVAKNGFNEGRLKDFSRSGLFIITKARLTVGDIITIAIQYNMAVGHFVVQRPDNDRLRPIAAKTG